MRTMRAFPSVTSAVHSAVGLLALSTAIFLAIAPVFVSPASACAPAPMLAVDTPLDFTPSELRLFKDPQTGKHYWYLTYEVVNNTGRDERFAPRIELLIDDGQIVRQGDGVSSGVTRQLKAMLKDPLLQDQFEVLGEVLQGKEHAKTGLVVFRADDLTPTELTMFVQGLSRETEKTQNPKTNETVTLRKTARVDYLVAGEPPATATVTHPIVTREWIFR